MRQKELPTRAIGPFQKVYAPVFIPAAILIVIFVLYAILFTEPAEALFEWLQTTITLYFSWLFNATATIILAFVLFLMISHFGNIRLGEPGERPTFSNLSWFAMMFSAGMGIGLVFWSVAEPLSHFVDPPYPVANATEAAKLAMKYTFFHWGLHAWSIYALVGLSLSFFAYNRRLPLTIRSAFYPLWGDKIYSWRGDIIDVVAVLGTLFGVATSLGLGVMQLNSGLLYLTGLPESVWVQIILIAIITAVATISLISGLDKGVRLLSSLNLWVSVILMAFVFWVGPSLFLLNTFSFNLGNYLQDLIRLSFWNGGYAHFNWQQQWTAFYWAWWIAWSPFVGMFMALISRGRTVREFIFASVVATTLGTLIWMQVFGGTAIYLDLNQGMDLAVQASQNVSIALFEMLSHLPLASLTSAIAAISLFVFFVTSSDSASLVIDVLTSGGVTNPPKSQKIFWAVAEGVVAALLLLTGGLAALQTAAITTGFPFAIVLLLVCWSLLKGLRSAIIHQ